MSGVRRCCIGILCAAGLSVPVAQWAPSPEQEASPSSPPGERPRLGQAYREMPISFEANRGQADSAVRYLARGDGYTLYLTGSEAILRFPASPPRQGGQGPTPAEAALRMDLVGASQVSEVDGLHPLEALVNYFNGSDPDGWHTRIPTYARVRYRDVYPGIDLVFHGEAGLLEYDFVLDPGRDPSSIALRFEGAGDLRIDREGSLVIATPAGKVIHRAPTIYQMRGEKRQEVSGRYGLEGRRVVFSVGDHDPSRPLVIDPVILTSSSFLGGTGTDEGRDIAVDSTGAAYVTGMVWVPATDFPSTPGAFDETHNGGRDAFVSKLSPSGDSLMYSTFLGGSGWDEAWSIAVDEDGAAYVVGTTEDAATDFPTTAGAFSETHNGIYDAFVTKLAPSGAGLAYSTFVGGSGDEDGLGIAIDGAGSAYVTGDTEDAATDFPTTTGAFSETHNGIYDAFVTKLGPSGEAPLAYSTFVGGTDIDVGAGIAVDAGGSAYVTGDTEDAATDFPTTTGAFSETHNGGADAFVTKLASSGGSLTYSTFLGGDANDEGTGIAVDGVGAAYLAGRTVNGATDLPTTPGAFDETHNGLSDAFVTKLSPSGAALGYSTFLGGSGLDVGSGLAVDGTGASYVTGRTQDDAADFPTTPGAFDQTHNGDSDAFAAELGPTAGAPLVYSTLLGGSGYDSGAAVALDGAGAAHVTGQSEDAATDFPTTSGVFDTSQNGDFDAFVATLVVPPPCLGRTVTLAGSAGDDTLTGTAKRDVIAALAGNDTVKGLGGKDIVCAGEGRDIANGAVGKDRLLGEGGRDKLKGGVGNDRLSGGKGKDTCLGGEGRDRARKCEREFGIP